METPTFNDHDRQRIAGTIKDAYYTARDNGGTMHTAADDAAAALEPVIEGMIRAARARVLEDTANTWSRGVWSDVMLPQSVPPAVPVIDYSNRVGDWLRDRAALERGADATGGVVDENAQLRAKLTAARGESPSGFWSQREWEDWSNDLATLIPEGDASRYSNPEGAQEGIIEDCLRAYVKERGGDRG